MDCKMTFDDNAIYRQQEIFDMKDWSQVDPRDIQAAKADLNYIALDGTIGCLGKSLSFFLFLSPPVLMHGGLLCVAFRPLLDQNY